MDEYHGKLWIKVATLRYRNSNRHSSIVNNYLSLPAGLAVLHRIPRKLALKYNISHIRKFHSRRPALPWSRANWDFMLNYPAVIQKLKVKRARDSTELSWNRIFWNIGWKCEDGPLGSETSSAGWLLNCSYMQRQSSSGSSRYGIPGSLVEKMSYRKVQRWDAYFSCYAYLLSIGSETYFLGW